MSKSVFRIVYLDDEVDLLDLFRENHQSGNLDIVLFSNFKLAIQYVNSNPVDLMILDYRLPGITGDEVAKMLPPDLPKILITGDIDIHPTVEYKRIFMKPYNISEMNTFLNECLANKN